MSYYMREIPGYGHQIWEINDAVAYRMGVPNPERGPDYFQAELGKTALETLRQKAPQWFLPGAEQFAETVLAPGQFYPRIARPSAHHPRDFPRLSARRSDDKNFIAMARSQLTTLMRQLELICQTVHPSPETFATFGHSIRNLLLIACTEVEMHWRGILLANNFQRDRYNTANYVLLQKAMRLGEYEIRFPVFPWLNPLRPFEYWNLSSPTTTLPWYDAYNAVKHNREHDFSKANLLNIFNAVSACAIMMVAQFGTFLGLGQNSELDAFFHVSATPQWSLADVYLPGFDWSAAEAFPVNYPFRR